jgi:hypothetical protein
MGNKQNFQAIQDDIPFKKIAKEGEKSSLMWLSWIRIRIYIGNAEPDPGAQWTKLIIKPDPQQFKNAFLYLHKNVV